MGLPFYYDKVDRKPHDDEVILSLGNMTAKTHVRVKDYTSEQVIKIKIILSPFKTSVHICMTTVNTDS